MLQTSSQGRQPFVYPGRCPSLPFSGSLTGNWPTCLVGYIIVQIIPSFFRRLASVLLQCSLCQLSVDQSFIQFPQPNWHYACVFNWGIQVEIDQLQQFLLSVKASLRVFYIQSFTHCCIYIRTLQVWFSPSFPKINLFAFTFYLLLLCSGVKMSSYRRGTRFSA